MPQPSNRKNELIVYTIYERPTDYPNSYVLRRFRVAAGVPVPDPSPLAVGTLNDCRAALPPGLVRIDPDPADSATVLESWL